MAMYQSFEAESASALLMVIVTDPLPLESAVMGGRS